jgi:hypothetical protein
MLKVRCFKDRSRKDLADWIISMFLVCPIGCALALTLADSCASGLADWMSTGASRLAKAVSAVPNRDSYYANLPICGGVFRQVQPICYLHQMSS